MTNIKRLFILALVVLVAGVTATGCSRKSRLARLVRKADADFAAERFDDADIEYRSVLRYGLDSRILGKLGIIYLRQGRLTAAYACLKKSQELNTKTPEVDAALGAAYLSLRDFRDAEREAKQALSLQPTNTEAMSVLAESAQSPGEAAQLDAYLRALPGQAGALADFHVAIATLAFRSGRNSTAETELRQALSINPQSSDAHYRLSQFYFGASNIVQATNELAAAARLASYRSPVRIKAAELLWRSSGPDAARAALVDITAHAPDYVPAWSTLMRLDFALKRFDDCKKDVAALLAKDPQNLEASLQSGMLALAQNDAPGAVAILQRLDSRMPDTPEVKYYLGVAWLNQGEPIKARQLLTQAVDLNTNYLQANLLLAQVEMRTQNSAAAVLRLERLIRQQPTAPELRYLLAEAYLMRQDPQRSMEIYRQLGAMRPEDPQVPYHIGIVSALTGDLDAARASFQKSLDMDPTFQPALDRLIDVDIGVGQFDTALQTVQARLDKDPKSARLWLLKAEIHRAQKQNDLAEQALNQSIAVDPNLVQAYVALANLYVAEHREQQALEKLNSVVSRTNDLSALMSIAVIHQQLKQFDASRDTYLKLLSLSPRFAPALNNLAYVYSEDLADLDKAYEYAQKARQLRPYDPYTADTLGWILFKRGDFARALGPLREGADGQPAEPEVQFHLGMDYYMLGYDGPARLSLQNAVSSSATFPGKDHGRQCLDILAIDPRNPSDKSVALLEKAVKADPQDAIAITRLAEIDETHGAYKQAAEHYEQGLRASPKNVPLMARLAALDYSFLKKTDDAFRLASAAHNLDENDPLPSAVLGRISYERGDCVYAETALEKAVAAENDPPAAWLADLAKADYALGRPQDALDYMQRAAAKAGPGPFADSCSQFLALVKAGNSPASAKAAEPQAKSGLQRDPRDLPALMVCGLAAEAAGDSTGASRYYEEAIASFPQFPSALRQQAILCANNLGDEPKALKLAEKASPSYPGDPQLACILGRGAYRRGDYARSAQLLQAASQRADDAQVFYYLGLDYSKLKRNAESKRALQKALALNLRPELAADARRVLSELQ